MEVVVICCKKISDSYAKLNTSNKEVKLSWQKNTIQIENKTFTYKISHFLKDINDKVLIYLQNDISRGRKKRTNVGYYSNV